MKQHFKNIFIFVFCLFLFASYIPAQASETVPDNNIDTEESLQPEVINIDITVTQCAARHASVTWDCDDETASYKITRATSENGNYVHVRTFTGKSGSFTYVDNAKKRIVGNTYYYKVEKITDGIVTGISAPTPVVIRLGTPANVKVTATSGNSMKVSWDKVPEASGYYVYRSLTLDGEYTKMFTTSKTTYTNSSVYSANSYYYKVYAYKKNKPDALSDPSEIAAGFTRPLKTTLKGFFFEGQTTLTWAKVSKADKYYVYKKKFDESYEKVCETTDLSYFDTDLEEDTRYLYAVKGVAEIDGKEVLSYYSDAVGVYTVKINPKKKMIALTFDDGPGPYTQAIVNCLKKYDARATFFVVGNRVNTYKSPMKSAYKHGNEIANHSYSHPILTRLSTSSVKNQMSKTDNAVKDVIGVKTDIMRAPGGGTNSKVRKAVGKPIIYWSVDTLDWKTRSKSKTVNSVMNNAKDGAIVLMHDIHSPTKEAALSIIPKLDAKGYQMVTVSEMALYNGYNMKNGTTYYSLK